MIDFQKAFLEQPDKLPDNAITYLFQQTNYGEQEIEKDPSSYIRDFRYIDDNRESFFSFDMKVQIANEAVAKGYFQDLQEGYSVLKIDVTLNTTIKKQSRETQNIFLARIANSTTMREILQQKKEAKTIAEYDVVRWLYFSTARWLVLPITVPNPILELKVLTNHSRISLF